MKNQSGLKNPLGFIMCRLQAEPRIRRPPLNTAAPPPPAVCYRAVLASDTDTCRPCAQAPGLSRSRAPDPGAPRRPQPWIPSGRAGHGFPQYTPQSPQRLGREGGMGRMGNADRWGGGACGNCRRGTGAGWVTETGVCGPEGPCRC